MTDPRREALEIDAVIESEITWWMEQKQREAEQLELIEEDEV